MQELHIHIIIVLVHGLHASLMYYVHIAINEWTVHTNQDSNEHAVLLVYS